LREAPERVERPRETAQNECEKEKSENRRNVDGRQLQLACSQARVF